MGSGKGGVVSLSRAHVRVVEPFSDEGVSFIATVGQTYKRFGEPVIVQEICQEPDGTMVYFMTADGDLFFDEVHTFAYNVLSLGTTGPSWTFSDPDSWPIWAQVIFLGLPMTFAGWLALVLLFSL